MHLSPLTILIFGCLKYNVNTNIAYKHYLCACELLIFSRNNKTISNQHNISSNNESKFSDEYKLFDLYKPQYYIFLPHAIMI